MTKVNIKISNEEINNNKTQSILYFQKGFWKSCCGRQFVSRFLVKNREINFRVTYKNKQLRLQDFTKQVWKTVQKMTTSSLQICSKHVWIRQMEPKNQTHLHYNHNYQNTLFFFHSSPLNSHQLFTSPFSLNKNLNK